MDAYTVRIICNNYLKNKKRYKAEISNYIESDKDISFVVKILSNNEFYASESISLNKLSELSVSSQLHSKISRFTSFIINGKI